MIFQTERLFLRELDQDDFHDLAEMLQNPEVMYAYEHDFSDEDVQEWLDRQRDRYRQNGFGLWALILKKTGEMIGQAGLTMQKYKESEVLEIGYLLKKEHWRHGYAIEAAKACKDYAFETLEEEVVHSIIKANNIPSIKVALKNGMTKKDEFIKRYYDIDMLHCLYSVRKGA